MTPLSKQQRAEVFKENIEKDDCGVIAIMEATEVPYKEALALAREYGYGTRGPKASGMRRGDIHEAIIANGKELIDVTPERAYMQTPATFCITHEAGTFIIHTPGHIQVLRDGDLYNAAWSAPIEMVLEVR